VVRVTADRDTASMTWGLTDLRWAVASQSWGRRRRAADCGPDVFGVHDEGAEAPYEPREADAAVEAAVGSDRPLVLVTGDRLAGSSRSLHRAVRRMAGDRWVLPLTEPHAVDLAGALRLARGIARRAGPVLVTVDDAPPALLDQLVPETCALLDADLRLVLTSRRTFLRAFPLEATRTALREATVEVPAASDGRPYGEQVRPLVRARAVLDPVGWTSLVPLALLRAVVDWERLGVPAPLTPALLAEIAPIYLPMLGAATPPEAELARAVRDGWRRDVGGLRLWHRSRRRGETHLVPDRLFSHLADTDPEPAGWAVPVGLVGPLRKRLDDDGCYRLARVALARGDGLLALRLCGDLPPGGIEAEGALQVGLEMAYRSTPDGPEPGRWDRHAVGWLDSVLERADGDLARRAHRALGFIEYRRGRLTEARPHLTAVAADDQLAQTVLADILLATEPFSPSARAEALRWLELAASGADPDLAPVAALRAATLLVEGGRDEDAEPLLVRATRSPDPRIVAQAELEQARLARRRGRRSKARALLVALLNAPGAVPLRTEVGLELGQLEQERGNPDAAARAFRRATHGDGPVALEACVLLAELEVSREQWDAAEAVAADFDRIASRTAGRSLRERFLAARGEAAFRRGDLVVARRCFQELREVEGAVGELAQVRLGQIELAEGNVLPGYRLLEPMQNASDPGLAELARSLAAAHQADALRLAQIAVLAERRVAAQQAARAGVIARA